MNDPVRQVIVMRKFKELRTGKYVAQGSHASVAVLSSIIKSGRDLTDAEKIWMDGSYTKICLYVDSEEELNSIYLKAKEAGLEVYMVVDNGLTEFKGEKTKTCLAIGPDYKSKIDPITEKLKML